jgi:MFS family permease
LSQSAANGKKVLLSYPAFIRAFPYLSVFAIACTFFSSFGQTFFISLFVPFFVDDFNISNAEFGLLYSGATVLSAVSLIWAGKLIDNIRLRNYVIFIFLLGMTSYLLLATAWMLPVLFVGLYLLRLAHQGLLTHTSHTTMARYFALNRGKALSIANLGYPLGEAFLPVTAAVVIGLIGWRYGYLSIALIMIVVFAPLMYFLLKNIPDDPKDTLTSEGTDIDSVQEKEWTRRMVLKDKYFYIILPLFIASPFLLTGLFLYQLTLAEFKGWSPELIAAAFVLFAAGRVVMSLAGGPLIDRFSARKLFPFILIPFLSGLLILMSGSHPFIAFAYLLMLGFSEGLSQGVKSALWAEIYGIKTLGTVRSLMTFVIILSTAVSPFLFGYLLDAGITFDLIALFSVFYILLASLISFPVRNL